MESKYATLEELKAGSLVHEEIERQYQFAVDQGGALEEITYEMRCNGTHEDEVTGDYTDEYLALSNQRREYWAMSDYVKNNYVGSWCRYYNGPWDKTGDGSYDPGWPCIRLIAFNLTMASSIMS